MELHNHAITIYNNKISFFAKKIQDFSIFGYMYEFWTISTVNMTYNVSQNYTNTVVSEHGIQTFEVVIVVFLFVVVI